MEWVTDARLITHSRVSKERKTLHHRRDDFRRRKMERVNVEGGKGDRRGWVSNSGSMYCMLCFVCDCLPFSFRSFWSGNRWISCEQSTGSKKYTLEFVSLSNLFLEILFFLLFFPMSKSRLFRKGNLVLNVRNGWRGQEKERTEGINGGRERRSKQEERKMLPRYSIVCEKINESIQSVVRGVKTIDREKKPRKSRVSWNRKEEDGREERRSGGIRFVSISLQVINWCLWF